MDITLKKHTVIVRFFLQCDKAVVILLLYVPFYISIDFLLNFMFKGALDLLYPPVTGGGYAVWVYWPQTSKGIFRV